MAAEESVETPLYGKEDDFPVSSEQQALSEFALSLAASNTAIVPGGVDEGDTRREAKLLMSLLANPPHTDGDNLEPVSASESELSYSSDSSHSRRDLFSFTCPSLSLENSGVSFARSQRTRPPHTASRRVSDVDDNSSQKKFARPTPLPAELLGRTLKVDDRNARRLSADAMARNILHSFQEALDWRIHAWIRSLSAILVKKETEMVESGASEEDLKSLLETCEAKLIVTLREMAKKLEVVGTSTSFRVLSHRIDDNADEPCAKKPRFEEPSDLEEGDEYQYTVKHQLSFEGVVNLHTPAGYAEITLEVPGTIEGTFLSSESTFEELKAVVIELDTSMLTSMVEKGCRQIVRESVQASMDPEATDGGAEGSGVATPPNAVSLTTPSRESARGTTPEASNAVLVTPRQLFAPESQQDKYSTEAVIFPIPDDLDQMQSPPSRISPQPCTPEFRRGSQFFVPPRTPSARALFAGPPMVSPPYKDDPSAYHDNKNAENGPSLPMLVEVACRAMRVD